MTVPLIISFSALKNGEDKQHYFAQINGQKMMIIYMNTRICSFSWAKFTGPKLWAIKKAHVRLRVWALSIAHNWQLHFGCKQNLNIHHKANALLRIMSISKSCQYQEWTSLFSVFKLSISFFQKWLLIFLGMDHRENHAS